MEALRPRGPVSVIGRYAMFAEIAAGGMATIHVGRLLGPVGFSRTVAIKRLHPQFAKDPEFVTMFLDEARLAARVRHPNVISPIDVVATQGELFLVMDYVQGESLARLVRAARKAGQPIPFPITRAIISGVLHGLHAAHEARSERGEPLGIVHRDVSPQNVLVGVDGIARVLDFGIAKAAGRASTTREGQVKGKIAYIAPERFHNTPVTRKSDIYATAVVLWEALTGERLFKGDADATTIALVLTAKIAAPSTIAPGISAQLDAVVVRGLNRDPSKRFDTARDMALALEACGPLATPTEIGEWVDVLAHAALADRAECIAEIEQVSDPGFHHVSSRPHQLAAAAHRPSPPPVDIPIISDESSVSLLNAASPSRSSPSMRTAFAIPRASLRVLRGRIAIAGSLGLLVLLIAGGLLFAHRSPASEKPAASASPLVEQARTRSDGTMVPLPPPNLGAAPVAGSTAVDTRVVSAPAAAPAPQAAQKALPPKSTKPNLSKASGQPDCDPPYVLDAVGHRHYKDQCL